MSKIKPIELISEIRGKICTHSNKYFAVRNGTHYTGTICNPNTKPPTEKQIQLRQKFNQTIQTIKTLTEEQKNNYKTTYKKQKKYKTLQGYIFAEEYNKIKQ